MRVRNIVSFRSKAEEYEKTLNKLSGTLEHLIGKQYIIAVY